MNAVTRSNRHLPTWGIRPADLFDSFFRDWPMSKKTMSVDIKETDNEYLIEAEVPGYNRENIKLTVNNGMLTLKAEHSEENDNSGEGYIVRERSYGSYQRSFQLPKGVDWEEIEADLNNGILAIKVPKVDKEEIKQIEIK